MNSHALRVSKLQLRQPLVVAQLLIGSAPGQVIDARAWFWCHHAVVDATGCRNAPRRSAVTTDGSFARHALQPGCRLRATPLLSAATTSHSPRSASPAITPWAFPPVCGVISGPVVCC
jgi:hypothetical protein